MDDKKRKLKTFEAEKTLQKAIKAHGSARKLAARLCVSRASVGRALKRKEMGAAALGLMRIGLKNKSARTARQWDSFCNFLIIQKGKKKRGGVCAPPWLLDEVRKKLQEAGNCKKLAGRFFLDYKTLWRAVRGLAVSPLFLWKMADSFLVGGWPEYAPAVNSAVAIGSNPRPVGVPVSGIGAPWYSSACAADGGRP